MKKLGLALLGATALAFTGTAYAADMAPVYKAPPPPPQLISGYLNVYVGWNWWDYRQYGHNSNGLFGGEARVNWWVAPNWAVQVDLEGETANREKTYNTSYYPGRWNTLVGAHYAWRDANRGALGVLLAAEAHGGSYRDYSWAHDFIAGIEGQLYYGNVTLYGQLGGLWRTSRGTSGSSSYGTVDDGWFLRVLARWFWTPYDRLQGEIGWFSGHDDYYGGRNEVLNWGALWQHRFEQSPLAVFISYDGFWTQGTSCNPDSYYRWTNHTVKIGASLQLNQPTEIAVDRNGATFDLPKFPRALAYGNNVSCETSR